MANWINVNSSIISKFKWENGNLYVKFLNEATYVYYHVSEDEFERMLSSPSKGEFLNDEIKGKYEYNRLY